MLFFTWKLPRFLGGIVRTVLGAVRSR
ncbi:MAG: stage V sporulation protein M [Paenibacillaceae bacterium]|nr:stage V sporulation protein M [Paenibacillaceae bacterium]